MNFQFQPKFNHYMLNHCVFYFEEIQPTYCLYLQNGLDFEINFGTLIKGPVKTF